MAWPAVLAGIGGAIATFGKPLISGIGKLFAGGAGAAVKSVGSMAGRALANPIIGGAAGYGLGSLIFDGNGGGGIGSPENIQAASGEVIGTLLDGGSDGMVRSAWRAARAQGATAQSLFSLIRDLDLGAGDKMMISSELERILAQTRRRRSVVPKSITKALKLMQAVQAMTTMRVRVKQSKRGRFGR